MMARNGSTIKVRRYRSNAIDDYKTSNAFRRHLNEIIDERIRLALEEE